MNEIEKKMTLAEAYEDLVNFKSKLIYLNSAKSVLDEKYISGEMKMTDEEHSGNFLTNWALEEELKVILSKLEELLRG